MGGASRYWSGAREFQRVAAGLAALVLVLVYMEPDASVSAVAIGIFAAYCGIAGVIYAGAAAVNRSERNPEFQRAVAARQAQAAESARAAVAAMPTPPARYPQPPRTNEHAATIEPPVSRGRP